MAATLKSRAQGLLRDIVSLLKDKEVPDQLRKELEDVRDAMKKTWADLGSETKEGDVMERLTEEQYDGVMAAVGYGPELYAPEAYTLADLMALKQAEHLREQVEGLTQAFYTVASNILYGPDLPRAKAGAMLALAQELAEMLTALEPSPMEEAVAEAVAEPIEGRVPEETQEAAAEPVKPTIIMEGAPMTVSLREQGGIVEAADLPGVEGGRRAPLRIRTVLIQAGAGNKRDAHYYPQEVLEASIGKFAGAKMFLTDHRDEEKSVRTEASFVEKVIGYEEGVGLVADVVAYDPDFCEKTRNLRDVGRLDNLHCSIYGAGTSAKGTVNGETYNVVKTIDEIRDIDWVTRAGAGGHAVEASDYREGEVRMVDRGTVTEVLGKAKLPGYFATALSERDYADEGALDKAIEEARQTIASLVGHAGDNGAGKAEEKKPMTEAERNERILAANQHWLGGVR